MTEVPALAHSVTALIEASAEQTFAFLADPMQVGNWALASMQAQPADAPGIYRGRSLFDGAQNHFAVTPHPQLLLVEYSVGPRDALTPRIRAQVIRAESVGLRRDELLPDADGVATGLDAGGALGPSVRVPQRRDLADQGASRAKSSGFIAMTNAIIPPITKPMSVPAATPRRSIFCSPLSFHTSKG